MSLLILEDLKKHFAAQEVLRGASLMIDPGTKVGIVGRNGGGKTTLFRMINGEEQPDWGKVIIRKGSRVGSVPQRPVFDAGVTVRQHVEAGLADAKAVVAEYEKVGDLMAEAEGVKLEQLMREHDRLSERVDILGGWNTEQKVDAVITGIGLKPHLWDREANTLSGGEKNRTALAHALVGGHDLLLLDEPTNHLDLPGIEWLENYLREMSGAVLIISHDRRLLNNSVDQILELEFGQLNQYPGNFSKYINLKAERYERDKKAYDQQQEMIRKESEFIKKHMGSQRTAEAKGRAKKLTHVVRLTQPHHDVRRPRIPAPDAARGGEKVLSTENLVGGYDGKPLVENVNIRIARSQRIGIVGPNGAGKTTLMKILAGRMDAMGGEVLRGHGESVAYFDQDTSHLRNDGNPWSEVYRRHSHMTDLEIRNHLARFLFRGSEVDKEVSTLSGGERARLALALLVMSKPSWLAMDEPTNHLDLAGRTALEEMLGTFGGALVCISHDREFLDGLTTDTWEVADGGVTEYEGNYSAYRAAKLAERDEATAARVRNKEAAAKKAQREAQEKTREKGKAAGAQGSKSSKKGSNSSGVRNPWKFEKLEKRIMELEDEIKKLNESIASPDVYSDSAKVREVHFQIAEFERELEEANEEWANWS
jgi:ATP-binding cassette, subfamily F, member 3